MPDPLTPAQRHDCMSHIRSSNTKPEIIVRRELWRRGSRYRLNVRKLPGTPDIVIGKYRTVIFINGCFWHGHKNCRLYTAPKTNVKFWKEKVARNRERDLLNNQRLESLSWSVVTIWECELKSKTFETTVERVIAELHQNKVKWEQYQQRRRSNREFAITEAKRKKLVREEVERELQEQFHIPVKICKALLEDYPE